jgi:hypothetical protein
MTGEVCLNPKNGEIIMGNFKNELNENVVPVVSATRSEDQNLHYFIEDASNVDDVIKRLKEIRIFDPFLVRNFYDRDGELDEVKLKSWIKNSFIIRTTYHGESTIKYIFDGLDLVDSDLIGVGDFIDDGYLNDTYLTDHEYGRSCEVYITGVTKSFVFDREKSKDTVILIDEEVGG